MNIFLDTYIFQLTLLSVRNYCFCETKKRVRSFFRWNSAGNNNSFGSDDGFKVASERGHFSYYWTIMTTIMTNASVSRYFPSPSRSLSLWLHFPKFYFTIMTSFCASPLPSIKVSFFYEKRTSFVCFNHEINFGKGYSRFVLGSLIWPRAKTPHTTVDRFDYVN